MPEDGSAGDLPEWYMPPRMIGGHVTGPVLISRTDGLVVAARQVVAYPVGLEVEIEAHARGTSPGGPSPGTAGVIEQAQPRFRLRFADGTEVEQDDEAGLRRGRGPMVAVSKSEGSWGGPDGGEDVRLTLWIRPLPPPGPLTVSCSWPEHGLLDAALVLDGDAIRTAAGRARPFWTNRP
ncbi:hypothetical protein SAVIM338S_00431 [Streptomyces avidinii]